jgi:hypothetical protein
MPRVLDPSEYDVLDPATGAGVRGRVLAPGDYEEIGAPETPGSISSALRGVKQGLTFDFGDEIAGALEAAFTSKTYKQARDEARAKDRAARESSPLAFGLGQILGAGATMAIPGAGAARLGTGVAGAAARGAGAGIVAGAGASEAEGIEGVVKDAAKGGLVGGATGAALGGLSRILGGPKGIVGGAPERADKQLLTGVGMGATPKVYKELNKKGASVVEELRASGLDKVARDPEALAAGAEETLKKVGGRLGEIYKAVDAASPTLPKIDVLRALKRVQSSYAGNPATRPIARQIKSLADDADEAWKGKFVPAEKVHEFVSSLGKRAFEGVKPADAAKASRDIWGATQRVLQRHVDRITKRNPSAGNLDELKKLNATYSALSPVRDAAAYKATRAKMSPTGLRQIAGEAANVWSGIAAVASGSPLPLLLSKPATDAAGAAGRAATSALARLVRAARAGQPTAQLVQDALTAGVPRATVVNVVSALSPSMAEATP